MRSLEEQGIEVWPENWRSVQIFRQMATQWYVGWHGRTGLNYASIYPLIDRVATSGEDWDSILADVQWMEAHALDAMKAKP